MTLQEYVQDLYANGMLSYARIGGFNYMGLQDSEIEDFREELDGCDSVALIFNKEGELVRVLPATFEDILNAAKLVSSVPGAIESMGDSNARH